MIRVSAFVASALFVLAVSGARAEETGPSVGAGGPPAPAAVEVSKAERIDTLFASLKTETDPDAASEIENAILGLWLESGSDTVDLLMQWTLKAMEEKQYPRALDFLDRIIVLDPTYVEGWNKRATVHFLMDDYGESIADIGKVLELEPRHFGALSGLGMIMRSIGDDKRAMIAYREALAVDPHLENVQEELDELEKPRPPARTSRRRLLSLLDEGDPEHVGGARRAERHAGGDDDPLVGLGEALAERHLAGMVDHVLERVRLGTGDAVKPPDQRQAASRRKDRRERDDRGLRPLARGADGGGARGGVAADRGEVQRLGDLARRRRDGVGAGRLGLGPLGVHDVLVVRVALHLGGDAVHGGDRLDRESRPTPTWPRA